MNDHVTNSIRESYALSQVPARRLAELAWAPFDELGEAFHEVVRSTRANERFFAPIALTARALDCGAFPRG